MPAGQEGKCAEPFSLALLPWNFHGAGGRGGKGLGGSLPSAAALLVYACQRVGRGSGLNFAFSLLIFLGLRGGVLRRSSPNGGAAFGIFMPASREGKQDDYCFLRFRC